MDTLAALCDWSWLCLRVNQDQAHVSRHNVWLGISLTRLGIGSCLLCDTKHVLDRCGWWRKLVVLRTSVNKPMQHSFQEPHFPL